MNKIEIPKKSLDVISCLQSNYFTLSSPTLSAYLVYENVDGEQFKITGGKYVYNLPDTICINGEDILVPSTGKIFNITNI